MTKQECIEAFSRAHRGFYTNADYLTAIDLVSQIETHEPPVDPGYELCEKGTEPESGMFVRTVKGRYCEFKGNIAEFDDDRHFIARIDVKTFAIPLYRKVAETVPDAEPEPVEWVPVPDGEVPRAGDVCEINGKRLQCEEQFNCVGAWDGYDAGSHFLSPRILRRLGAHFLRKVEPEPPKVARTWIGKGIVVMDRGKKFAEVDTIDDDESFEVGQAVDVTITEVLG